MMRHLFRIVTIVFAFLLISFAISGIASAQEAPVSETDTATLEGLSCAVTEELLGGAGFGRSGFGRSGFGRAGFGRSGFGRSGFGRSGFGRSGFGRAEAFVISDLGHGEYGVGEYIDDELDENVIDVNWISDLTADLGIVTSLGYGDATSILLIVDFGDGIVGNGDDEGTHLADVRLTAETLLAEAGATDVIIDTIDVREPQINLQGDMIAQAIEQRVTDLNDTYGTDDAVVNITVNMSFVFIPCADPDYGTIYEGIDWTEENPIPPAQPPIAGSVVPIFECTFVDGGDTFARFGYISSNDETVFISASGGDNQLNPSPPDPKHPEVFEPGVRTSVVDAKLNNTLEWLLLGVTSSTQPLFNDCAGTSVNTDYVHYDLAVDTGYDVQVTSGYDGLGPVPEDRSTADINLIDLHLECVYEANGEAVARVEYTNLNDFPVYVQPGKDNKVGPNPSSDEQVTYFFPVDSVVQNDGVYAFEIRFKGKKITWSVGNASLVINPTDTPTCEFGGTNIGDWIGSQTGDGDPTPTEVLIGWLLEAPLTQLQTTFRCYLDNGDNEICNVEGEYVDYMPNVVAVASSGNWNPWFSALNNSNTENLAAWLDEFEADNGRPYNPEFDGTIPVLNDDGELLINYEISQPPLQPAIWSETISVSAALGGELGDPDLDGDLIDGTGNRTGDPIGLYPEGWFFSHMGNVMARGVMYVDLEVDGEIYEVELAGTSFAAPGVSAVLSHFQQIPGACQNVMAPHDDATVDIMHPPLRFVAADYASTGSNVGEWSDRLLEQDIPDFPLNCDVDNGNPVDVTVSISGDGDNVVGESHVITIALEKEISSGLKLPFADQDVIASFYTGGEDSSAFLISDGETTSEAETATCTTDADGICTVTIISADYGTDVVQAAWVGDIFVGDVATEESRITDCTDDGTCATKVWYEASLALSPEEGNVVVGVPHDITATVQYTADGETYFNAPDDTIVTFDVSNEAEPKTCTTTNGECTIQVTSDVVGTITVSAETSFSVDGIEGVFTAAADATNDGTIIIIYPNEGGLTWMKVDERIQPLGGASFQLCPATDPDCDNVIIDNQGDDEANGDGDGDGVFVVTGLPANVDYVITEVKAPGGYMRDSEPRTVTVALGLPTDAGVFVNLPTNGVIAHSRHDCSAYVAGITDEFVAFISEGGQFNPGRVYFYTTFYVDGTTTINVDHAIAPQDGNAGDLIVDGVKVFSYQDCHQITNQEDVSVTLEPTGTDVSQPVGSDDALIEINDYTGMVVIRTEARPTGTWSGQHEVTFYARATGDDTAVASFDVP